MDKAKHTFQFKLRLSVKQQISVPSGHPVLTVNGDSSDRYEAGTDRMLTERGQQ